jgi:arylsulfatase A-like enzyme
MIFTGCGVQRTQTDLKDEFEFSKINNLFYIHDFLTEKAAISTREGWSRFKSNGTRLGVYPRSVLNFFLLEKRSLNLIGLCSQPRADGIPARSMAVRINGSQIGVVGLNDNAMTSFKLAISEEVVEAGHNAIEFIYFQGVQNQDTARSFSNNQRIFSVVFRELVLSSDPSLEYTRNIMAIEKRLVKNNLGSFIQFIPGQIDFYVDIPSGCSLTAEGKFYSLDNSTGGRNTFQGEVNFQQIRGKETDSKDFTFSEINPEIKIKKSPVLEAGPSRIRFRVRSSGNEKKLSGFIVWNKTLLAGRLKKIKKDQAEERALKTLRSFLSEKNTVIIILDAARADRFSSYGHFRPTTPRISDLSQEGTLFANAFSESLSTRSSTATLFTGFPLSVTNVRHLRSQLPDEFTTLAEHFKSSAMKSTGFTGVGNIGQVFGFTQGFDDYFELYKKEDFFRKSQEYLPYLFPWLDKNKDEHFFLYVHFKEPHAHYSPLPPFLGMFSGEFQQKVGLTEYKKIAEELNNEQVEYIRACYDETLASADSVVGELIDRFRSLRLLEKSLIFITSDHGELLGEHGRLFGHGKSFAEEGIHIPLVMRVPDGSGIPIPGTVDAIVKTADIFATLADIYQFDVPYGIRGGKSLLPLLVSPDEEINPYIVVERAGTPVYCLRSKTHKLLYSNERYTQFFDLETDPGEKRNLYSEENLLANYYLTQLKKWMAGQSLTRSLLLGKSEGDREVDQEDIDEKTLENLKTLGYIK